MTPWYSIKGGSTQQISTAKEHVNSIRTFPLSCLWQLTHRKHVQHSECLLETACSISTVVLLLSACFINGPIKSMSRPTLRVKHQLQRYQNASTGRERITARLFWPWSGNRGVQGPASHHCCSDHPGTTATTRKQHTEGDTGPKAVGSSEVHLSQKPKMLCGLLFYILT